MKLLGILIAIAGVLTGVDVGFWVLFVGGIVDIIYAIKAPVTEASAIGFAVLKIFFAGLAGGVIAWVGIAIGAVFGFTTSYKFRYRHRR